MQLCSLSFYCLLQPYLLAPHELTPSIALHAVRWVCKPLKPRLRCLLDDIPVGGGCHFAGAAALLHPHRRRSRCVTTLGGTKMVACPWGVRLIRSNTLTGFGRRTRPRYCSWTRPRLFLKPVLVLRRQRRILPLFDGKLELCGAGHKSGKVMTILLQPLELVFVPGLVSLSCRG